MTTQERERVQQFIVDLESIKIRAGIYSAITEKKIDLSPGTLALAHAVGEALEPTGPDRPNEIQLRKTYSSLMAMLRFHPFLLQSLNAYMATEQEFEKMIVDLIAELRKLA